MGYKDLWKAHDRKNVRGVGVSNALQVPRKLHNNRRYSQTGILLAGLYLLLV